MACILMKLHTVKVIICKTARINICSQQNY